MGIPTNHPEHGPNFEKWMKAVDRQLGALNRRTASMTSATIAGQGPLMPDVLEPPHTPSTTFITPEAGWLLVDAIGQQFGNGFVQWNARVERSGADVVVPASGNIGNTLVALLERGWAPGIELSAGSLSIGRDARYAVIPDGNIFMIAVGGPSIDITAGEQFTISGAYFAAQ